MIQRIQRTTISTLLKMKIEIRPAPAPAPAQAAPAQPKQDEPNAPPAARPAGAKPFRRQMPAPLTSMASYRERVAAVAAAEKAAKENNEQPAQAEDKKDE
jgi:hypothetical protein